MLDAADLSQSLDDVAGQLERIFLFSISWALGGLLEPDGRLRYVDNWKNRIQVDQKD